MTIAEWLRALEAQLELTASRAEAEAHILSEPVLKASRTLQGTARQALRAGHRHRAGASR